MAQPNHISLNGMKEGKPDRRTLHRMSCCLQVGCLRTTATVFKISCESAASHTALTQVLRSPVVSIVEQFEIAGHLAFNR
jgi:hypothetical protein